MNSERKESLKQLTSITRSITENLAILNQNLERLLKNEEIVASLAATLEKHEKTYNPKSDE